MAAQVIIGTLGVIFGADTSGLVRGARTAEQQLRNVERAASNVTHTLRNAFLAVAGPAALGYLIKSSIDAVSAQKDLAERLHVSVGAVQVMQRAAELAGMSNEEFNKSAERLNRAIGGALRDSTGKQSDAFKRLGLSAKELQSMDLDQRFIAISNAINALNLSAPQTADFLMQIGIRGGRLGNLFIDGADGIAKARKELEIFGLVNTNEQAARIEAAGDAMTTFKLAAQGVGNALAGELSPFIVTAAKNFTDMAEEVGGVRTIVRSAVDGVVSFVGDVLDLGVQLKQEVKEWAEYFTDMVNVVVRGANSVRNLPGISWLGGKDIEEIKGVGELFGSTTSKIIRDKDELRRAVGAPLPSDAVNAWVRNSRAAADAEAEAWAAAQKKRRTDHATNLDGISSKERESLQNKLLTLQQALATEGNALIFAAQKQEKELDDLRKKGIVNEQMYYAMRLQIQDQFNKKSREMAWTNFGSIVANEQEQLAYQHQQRLEKLGELNATQLEMIGGYEEARARLEEKYALERTQLMANQWSAAAGIVSNALSQISSIMGEEGKKGFTLMKGLAMAAAAVQQMGAIVAAYKTGNELGGPAVGAVFAGIATAATAAMLAKMAGIGPDSKTGAGGTGAGGGGGGGGGRSAPSAAPPAQASPSQSVFVRGLRPNDLFSGAMVEELAKNLLTYQRNGGTIIWDER